VRGSLLGLLLLTGCSSTSPGGDILTIVNQTPSTLVVFPHPGGTLIDPVPVLEPGTYSDNLIPPGGSLAVDEIPGYDAGGDIALFVYSVRLVNVAEFAQFRLVTAAEMNKSRRIVLRDVPSPRAQP
jgi:hypothetical protein